MQRRLFLRSGSAASIALAFTACGGGGGGGGSASGDLAVGGSIGSGGTGVRNAVPGDVSYPFGARLDAYVAGIKPNNVSAAQMDDSLRACYDRWKRNSFFDVPTVPGGKVIGFNSPTYLAVSEGMGYGMLITVLFAGHDPQARDLFDALLTTVRARPAYSITPAARPYLMDWRLNLDGSSSDSAGGGWNAMDGDQDIAMALLMADRQWGSNGKWNYRQEGINTINAMKLWNMKPDGTTKGLATSNISRTSDYMIGHFRAYRQATGDDLWDRAIERSFRLIDRMQRVYSPNHGLMPDFIVKTDTDAPEPSPGFMGDFVDTEMHYFENAKRNPWRWGTDYVTSGDARWGEICNRLITVFRNDNGEDPARTAMGYRLDGSPLLRPYPNWMPLGAIGPQLCGAMSNGNHQDYLNKLWAFNVNNFSNDYYDAELQLIPMLVASGNWWTP